ncbi:hypothetical protein, partial [Aeromonas enteropelogenes]|uniref:hypothetical protein n=1 Tax=Aeromonas enteropelogenes TaxID=29489 RepID=UPI003B9F7985
VRKGFYQTIFKNETSIKSASNELISAVIVLMPRPGLSGKLRFSSQLPRRGSRDRATCLAIPS